jgi:hypothetical protein
LLSLASTFRLSKATTRNFAPLSLDQKADSL